MAEHDPTRSPFRDAIRACRDLALWALLFGAGVNLLYLAPSLYMMQVYDRVLPSQGLTSLAFLSLVLALALACLVALDSLRNRLSARMSLRLDRRLSPLLLDLALRRDARSKPRRQQAVRELDTLRGAMTGPAFSALMDLPWAPIYVIVTFILHPAIGLLTVGGGVLLVLLAIANERSLRRSVQQAAEIGPRLYAAAESDSAASEAVSALGMRGALVQRQLRRRAELNALQMGSIFQASFFSGATKFLRLALQSAALGLGAWLAVERQITPGALIAASILTSRALTPLDQMVASWRQLAQAAGAMQLVREVAESAEAAPERTQLPAPRGALRFERVSVRAPGTDRAALSDVSFEAAPGEVLGIVGASGAGKSTCARLAAGALKPDVGVVRLDGAKLDDWDPDTLGRHVGYLPQEVSLLAGTVADNIRRFVPRDAQADADVVEAARAAGAHDMILKLPKGYETEIAPGGRGMSFGQSQRVALARALFRNPALLVLDEPNAHLDAEGEAALMGAIRAAKARGAVTLIVAHRASVLATANRIMAMRDGKVEWIEPREEVIRKRNAAAQAAGALTPMRPRENLS